MIDNEGGSFTDGILTLQIFLSVKDGDKLREGSYIQETHKLTQI